MYIKYDESELFEFFECEPVPVGDDDAGDLIFTSVSYTHLTLPTTSRV